MKYVDVILPLPLEALYTYSLPQTEQGRNLYGYRVLVPLGRSKTYTAIVVRCHDDKPDYPTKDIYSVLDNTPMLLSQQLQLWKWISDYYICPIGDVYKAAMPSGLKADDAYKPKTELFIGLTDKFRNEESLHIALNILSRAGRQLQVFTDFLALSHWDSLSEAIPEEEIKEVTREELMNVSHCTAANIKALIDKGFLYTYKVEVGRLNDYSEPSPQNIHQLNTAQTEAYNSILMEFMKKKVVLLNGVTSSGKTEIYIHLIQQAIDKGQQVLYLLPEIALTVQIMQRLKKVFGNRLGIYHSKYSDAERVEIWQKQLSKNPYDVILGARSSVFLPFQKLGLVIIDEEHETSFKQQDPSPRYHVRSAAIVLAQMYGARTLLGSATPSMDSYYNAQVGKYGYVALKTRYKDIQLPKISVVDIKDLRRRKMMSGPFSPDLIKAMRDALADNKQIILFQNRRGFAPMIECKTCGWVPRCKNCDVSLTLHRNLNTLTCHYCGYTYSVPVSCPSCEEKNMREKGYGTEKIEDLIRDIFPDAKVARMDLDTTRTKNAYERIINDFSTGKTNILIGTQMVTKGLDFERVSLVGILDADSMLNYPDFRAYEYAFMMMSQVSGRAGRKGKQGSVILQTRNPELPVIHQVVNHNYEGLYESLVEERRMFRYPPFYRIVYVYIKHTKDHLAENASIELAGRLRQWFGTRVLGPDKPAVARVKTQCIRKIVIKLENGLPNDKVRAYLKEAQRQTLSDKRYASVTIYYDVDPM